GSARTAERHLATMGLALAPDPAAVPALAALARDPQAVVADSAITGLAGRGAAAALADLVADPAATEQHRPAGRALAGLGATAAPAVLDRLLAADREPRQRLAQILAALGPEAGPVAAARLDGAPDAALPQLLWALAALRPAAVAARLTPLAEHPDPLVRAAVAMVAGRLRDPALLPLMRRLAQDPEPRVARSASAAATILATLPGDAP
ncbi:MAG: hypothetical protein RLZZ127_3066, partial [Planctomycetota bacterium]